MPTSLPSVMQLKGESYTDSDPEVWPRRNGKEMMELRSHNPSVRQFTLQIIINEVAVTPQV